MNVVLVGCGAMSKAWLEGRPADRRHRDCRARRLDADRAQGAGARVRPRKARRSGPASTRCSTSRPDAVFDVVVPAARRDVAMSAFAHDCHLLTEKPLADSWDNARAIVDAARARRAHPCRRPEPPLSRQCQAHRRFLNSGAIGAPTSIHCRFLHRPAFRRLSRGDAPRAAARHGDPYVRRGPLHGERRAGERLLPGMGAAQLLVSPGLVGDRHLRARRRQDVQLPRQLVRRRLSDQLGQRWRIVGERGGLIWDGNDDLGAELAGPVREGLLDRASRSSCRRSIHATVSAAISA